jgi:hypothetical protein
VTAKSYSGLSADSAGHRDLAFSGKRQAREARYSTQIADLKLILKASERTIASRSKPPSRPLETDEEGAKTYTMVYE